MAVMIKCKMCGGDLVLTEGSTIATCEYCGTTQTVPTMDNEKKLVQFERAERLRRNCEFDKAAGVYESIVADFRQEAEAYWGLVLCKYGIEYVDDPATGKKVPTCHRSSFESVMEDSNFEQALENADVVARKVYREEAKQIEELRKAIVAVSNNEAPYDIFICYKETAEDGQRTVDSVLAQDIYDALVEKNYRVFFSRITLEDKIGQEYEPYIFAALNSAKVMLAIGTDYEYFNAVWVKNEWSRYLKLMEKDKSKHLIPCFKGIDAYDMPKEFGKLQAQDLGKVGAVQDLLRGIDKLIAAKPAVQAAQVSDEDMNRAFLYNSAVEAAKSGKPKEIQEAIRKLESLGEWKDAPAQLAAAKANLKKAKAKKRNKVLLIIGVIAALIIGFYAYAQYNEKMYYYNSALEYENLYYYKEAIWEYEKIRGFKDADERLAAMEQDYLALENAMLELLRGDEPGEDYSGYFRIDGSAAEVEVYIHLTYATNYDLTGAESTYYSSGFSFGNSLGTVPQAEIDKLESFFGEEGRFSLVRYNRETQEYLIIANTRILFRGKLNSDGSLTVYNDAGTTYNLLPISYSKNSHPVQIYEYDSNMNSFNELFAEDYYDENGNFVMSMTAIDNYTVCLDNPYSGDYLWNNEYPFAFEESGKIAVIDMGFPLTLISQGYGAVDVQCEDPEYSWLTGSYKVD